jgi:hypothetical protein
MSQDREKIAGSTGRGKEPLGSIKYGEFPD